MTGDWIIRRCDSCGKLESEPAVELINERRQGEPDRVAHVVAGGLRRCGYLIEVAAVKS